jgi:peroxiredoxin
MCEYDGCNTRPSFNIPGGKSRFCSIHKTVEMIDVNCKGCQYEGCEKSSSDFDIPGGKGRFCTTHKTDEMINVRKKACEHSGCKIVDPNFDIPGGKGRFCATHKTDEMIDVRTKRCSHIGCKILNPNFGIPGGRGRFCFTHKTDDMISVRAKICEHPGCKISSSFDIPGGRSRFCFTHKTDDMINIRAKSCIHIGCQILIPNFDIPGGKGKFCFTHKTDEMIDVRHPICNYEGCTTRPSFDIPGGKGRFCATHKTSDMMNVIDKLCEHEGCQTSAYYGKPGHSKTHCHPHREKGMIRNSNARCESCKNPAIYGTNWIPKHCEKHKTLDDQNLVEQQCVSCGLLYVLDKENKCENCNPVSFLVTRLAKQNALMAYLDFNDLKCESTDKVVENGACGKERPDRVYDFGDKIVILECDEHQHQDRQCLCEQTRMINIGQSFGGIPVYFIRWNPDDYSPEDHNKDPEEVSKRHKLVGDLIRDIKSGRHLLPKGLLSVFYMYYDGWSSMSNESWEVITKME